MSINPGLCSALNVNLENKMAHMNDISVYSRVAFGYLTTKSIVIEYEKEKTLM